MTGPRSRILACGGILLAAALAGCAGHPESLAPPDLEVVCSGEGSPTVILDTGFRGTAQDFASLQEELAEETRVCSYSRAGLGASPSWPSDLADPSAGMAADQLRATLDEKGVPGPYVVLGWSWGGLVAQAFAARHQDVLAGLVLEDSTVAEQFDHPGFDPSGFEEGGHGVDLETTVEDVDGLDIGSIPLVVLTQGQMEGVPDPEFWLDAHDRLASISANSLHIVAADAGHAIHERSEALVVKAVEAVVRAARAGTSLPPCDDREWMPYAGACRVP